MIKKTVFILLLVTLFAACSKSKEVARTLAQVAVVATEATMMPSPIPTNTPTAVPTLTNTPSPTQINRSTPTATTIITPTPSPTSPIWVEVGTPVAQSEVIGVENVTQVTELARWGRGVIRDIDLSADGRWLAVASGSGAYIHDLQDFEARPLAIETGGDVTAVSISPTGDKVALVTWEDQLQLWQVEPMEQLFVADEVQKVQFSPDGEVLAITKRIVKEHTILEPLELWDVRDGAVIKSYRPSYDLRPMIKFSPSGSRVAVWSQNDDIVKVYDLEKDPFEYRNQAILQSELGAMIGDVAFLNEDELRLMVVEIVDSTFVTGRIEVQEATDNTVLFSADSIGYFGTIRERACDDPIPMADPPDPAIPTQMEVSSDSKIVALYYQDSSLRFYHAAGGNQPYFIEKGVVDFEFSPDGQTWVAGFQDGRLQVRRLDDGAVLESMDAYESPIFDTIVSADDAWFGVVHVDEVKIYHRADGNLQYRYPTATKIAFAPNGESFTLAYQDGHLELYDINSGELIKSITGHEDQVTALDYLPTGELLSAGADCNIIIWEMPNMIPIDSLENILVDRTISFGEGEDEKVAVHIQDFGVMPDGKSVIGQFSDFGIWEMEDGRIIREPSSDYRDYSKVLAIASDGRTLAVQSQRIPKSWDNEIHLIGVDARLGDFSPDTKLFVGGQWEYYEVVGELNFWQASSPMELVHTVITQNGMVTAVNFTQDGQLIISGGQDGIVRLWGVSSSR